MKYTCHGEARGECGITHRSRAAAERCCERDDCGCRGNTWAGSLTRPYSDRVPWPADPEAEQAERLAAMEDL